ncbi:hypothetical protein ADK60_02365 [Streptomyces sp. XY431]|uniref:hypothetical protein n=1 Tax=Streptomyces sp. XY431 TaxID=1415562 RepID=UPI0006B00C50|nr:hypothetical protein [Streptomyces sp. XY431]KOV38378.1 hypothetical protein ADK60_02365 [Streptomyces sp. XY431]
MVESAAEGFARELEALKAASGLSLNDIIGIGERLQSPARFTKGSLSEWFNAASVPSGPVVFAALVHVLESAAARRDPDRPRRSAQEWEELRRAAARERRPTMGAGRRERAAGRNAGGPARGASGGPRTAGAGHPGAGTAPAEPAAAVMGDAAKAGRVLAALPHRAQWLGVLRDPESFPIHVTVIEAYRWACERVQGDVVDFVDPDLHETHTALLEVMARLQEFIGDRMYGPDPGRPWIDLSDYDPDRQADLPVLADIRGRLDARYRLLVNTLSRQALLWEMGQPTTAATPARTQAPADAVVRAARLAAERWAPLDHLEAPRDRRDAGDAAERIHAMKQRTAHGSALAQLRDALDTLASYLPLALGPRPTLQDLALLIEQAQPFASNAP